MLKTIFSEFKSSWILFFSILLFQPSAKGQEMFGVTHGNYSGVNSIMLNPAMMTNSQNFLDINLFAADYFIIFAGRCGHRHRADCVAPTCCRPTYTVWPLFGSGGLAGDDLGE